MNYNGWRLMFLVALWEFWFRKFIPTEENNGR